MNIILLSGGSGERLWPLSSEKNSKQFIKFFDDGKGGKESMVQRMYHRIKKIDPNSIVTIATSQKQVPQLINQLGSSIDVSLEPCRKDTFPAIALAISYLYDIRHVGKNEPVVVCPVDSYVDDSYFIALEKMSALANSGESNLVLMGIEPTFPSEKYGYIIPETMNKVAKVSMFREKPSSEIAEKYIKQGALWNSGVFAFKLAYLLKRAHEMIGFTDYHDLSKKYKAIEKISFDYAIVENEKSIEVMRFSGVWDDLGSWDSLTKCINVSSTGNVILGEDCKNDFLINDLVIPVLCVGVKNLIMVSSTNGILITNNENASKIKKYVEKLDATTSLAKKSAKEREIIDTSENSLTTKICLKKGEEMFFDNCDGIKKFLAIISGNGLLKVNEETKHMHVGDFIHIKDKGEYILSAEDDLIFIEVEISDDFVQH